MYIVTRPPGKCLVTIIMHTMQLYSCQVAYSMADLEILGGGSRGRGAPPPPPPPPTFFLRTEQFNLKLDLEVFLAIHQSGF